MGSLLQEGSSNVAFPNSMLSGFLLEAPRLVPPRCHSAGAEPACGMGQGLHRKPQHGASRDWAPLVSSARVTCGMNKADAVALTPSSALRGSILQIWWCLYHSGDWFLLAGPAPAWVIPPA